MDGPDDHTAAPIRDANPDPEYEKFLAAVEAMSEVDRKAYLPHAEAVLQVGAKGSLNAHAYLIKTPTRDADEAMDAETIRKKDDETIRKIAMDRAAEPLVRRLMAALKKRTTPEAKAKRRPRGPVPLTTEWEVAAAEIIRRSRGLDLEGLCHEFGELPTPPKLRTKYSHMPTNMVAAYGRPTLVGSGKFRKALSNWRGNFERRVASLDARASIDSSEATRKKSAKTSKSAAKRQV